MRYTADRYATAFLATAGQVPAGERRDLMRRFIKAVAKHGDRGRIDAIIAAIEQRSVKNRGGHWVRIEFARAMPEETIARFSKRFASPDRVAMALDPSLIAGARITIDGEEELDLSFARKLRRLLPRAR